MNRDPQAERAFGRLIDRENKRKSLPDLESAHNEILRLRRRQENLISCIEGVLEGAPTELALCLSAVVQKYKNEY